MIYSPPKKAVKMQSWKRFRRFRCLSCIPLGTTHSKEIREAIREDCHSQHGMEFIEIDRVLQTLPFSQGNDLLDRPPIPKRPYRRRKSEQNS